MSDARLSSIEEIIADARHGKMFILVDDENRENEGDLIIPAQMADAEAVNFMARHGRGLICLALTPERVEALRLPLMPRSNSTRQDTAFTLSIEAKEGIHTGISAADRATTIATAINPLKGAEDIATPGHVFPLRAREGGVLVRAGHTEAAVDIARLAGLYPAGVICEIMKDDGTMARLPDLIPFAEAHGLKIATIADLIAYRLTFDKLVERTHSTVLNTERYGGWQLHVYTSRIDRTEHIALVKGAPSREKPVLVRMHAVDILADMLTDTFTGRAGHLDRAMSYIAEKGEGVVVLLREPRKDAISQAVKAHEAPQGEQSKNLRDYGIGAQILLDLGVHQMILLTNSRKQVIGVEGYDLAIAGFEPLNGTR